jgi:hypothetical protein
MMNGNAVKSCNVLAAQAQGAEITTIEGLAAADWFLGGLHVPPPLRRLVVEGRAGVERSLKARAFDGR